MEESSPMLLTALQWRGPRPNTGWPCEPPAPLESHHRRSPHHPVSRELKTNQPTLHTPSRSKLIVISKLIVKCKISFYLLTLKPTYYYCIAHFSFQYYTYDTHSIVPFSFFTFLSMTKWSEGAFLTRAAHSKQVLKSFPVVSFTHNAHFLLKNNTVILYHYFISFLPILLHKNFT